MSRSALVLFLMLGLLVLHHDLPFWDDDRTLWLGFLPVGLAYHAGYSIAVALFWWWAMNYAWPEELEESGDVSSAAERD